MKKNQSAPNCFYGIFLVVFIIFNAILSYYGLHKYETGFFAGFLFIIGFPLFFQITNLNIPYKFIHNKTLHI